MRRHGSFAGALHPATELLMSPDRPRPSAADAISKRLRGQTAARSRPPGPTAHWRYVEATSPPRYSQAIAKKRRDPAAYRLLLAVARFRRPRRKKKCLRERCCERRDSTLAHSLPEQSPHLRAEQCQAPPAGYAEQKRRPIRSPARDFRYTASGRRHVWCSPPASAG